MMVQMVAAVLLQTLMALLAGNGDWLKVTSLLLHHWCQFHDAVWLQQWLQGLHRLFAVVCC